MAQSNGALSKIVVTGGAGFIGTNMCLYLMKHYPQHQIISIDVAQPLYPVRGVQYLHGDIRSQIFLRAVLKENVARVFHLAAEIGTHETFLNSDVTNSVNIQGRLNLLELAREFRFPLFVASKPIMWLNPYSITKEAAEKYSLMYHKVYGVQVSVIRWFSVYGPFQYIAKYQKAIPTFIHRALNNLPLPIYGDGTQEADFVFVDDAVAAADRALNHRLFGKVLEFGLCRGVKVKELAEQIIRLTASSSTLEFLPMRIGEDAHSKVYADKAKMPRSLGRPIPLEEGLQKTADFFKTTSVFY